MSTPNPSRNTNAFFAQAGISFAVALLAMVFAVLFLPVDPWIRAFLGLGTLYLTTSSFTLACSIEDSRAATGGIAYQFRLHRRPLMTLAAGAGRRR